MLKWGPPLIGEQGPPDGYSGSEWHDCTVLSTCALAYVILSSSKIQNGGILMLTYPGCPGKRMSLFFG